MNILDYIKGQRKGSDAHRIEKDSMKDPFMYEAIEGFDSIDDNHLERITNIQKRLRARSQTAKRHRSIWQSVAASAAIIFALGGYLLIGHHKSNNLYAQEMSINTIINVYVPENYYTENIVVIAKHNTETVKAYTPNISKFKIDESTHSSVSKEELATLSEAVGNRNETLVDIYIPENFESEYEISESSKKGKPEPVIGYEKYKLYLKKSLRKPTDDSCKDRKGKVAVEFSVDERGRPYLFEVKYSLCETSDNEAIRLIQSGPKWTSGNERVTVKVEF